MLRNFSRIIKDSAVIQRRLHSTDSLYTAAVSQRPKSLVTNLKAGHQEVRGGGDLSSRLILKPTTRFVSSSNTLNNRWKEEGEEEDDDEEKDPDLVKGMTKEEVSEQDFVERFYDPKDRTRIISPELSIKYMESNAYRTTYGEDPVWKHYRRNMKGGRLFTPKTRIKCIRNGRVTGASPCPICRDMYLVIDYRNVKLLQQFIDKYSGVVYDSYKTGLCQQQWQKLLIHIEKAKDHGLIDIEADQIYYDTSLYKK